MTQKKISGILLLITMIALLASCSKRIEPVKPSPQPVPAPGKLSKLEYNGGYDSLYYNPDGTLQRVVNYYTTPGPYTEVFTFEYNNDKTVSKITDNNGESYVYKYFGGLLTAVSHFVNGAKKDYRIYDYVDGRLSSVEEYYEIVAGGGHDYTSQRQYTYYADGNLKEEISYSFDPVTRAPIKDFTIEHSNYDNKNNPADHINRFLYLSFVQMAKNNAGKMIAKSEQTGASTEFNYEYTYDLAARPATRKMSYVSGGQAITETITYHYYQ